MVKFRRFATTAALAVFIAIPSRARIAGHGSSKSESQSLGHGSSKMEAPTPNPAGQLLPGCTCPMITPRLHEPAPAPARVMDAKPPSAEVEVLTVDVRLANKIRCDNTSIADDVAKLLKIPVQRVSVTPWSWTLSAPQNNYLAFVQEDHDRCDCRGDSGNVVQGQGFRKVTATKAMDGWMLGKDTSVMTVSQYKALRDAAKTPRTSERLKTVEGPPPARIQMLTRDPCLVQLLRSETPRFRQSIAHLLGVPEDKVVVEPPAVKGTIGLMQLDTAEDAEEKLHQVPVLAVRECSRAGAAKLEEQSPLRLLSRPDGANAMTAGNVSMPAVYAVEALNTTSDMNATQAPEERVALVMKLNNINYDLLSANMVLLSSFTAATKEAIGMSGHVAATAVTIALYPDSGHSVVIDVKIAAHSGTAAAAILAFLNGTICEKTSSHLNAMTALSSVALGVIDCGVVSLASEDGPFPADESNRAWIAFWNIVLLPPFATDGAWRLLNMVNTPSSQLSKLLPLTLARVPGLKYRGLLDPNALDETRLPPPEDKAVGFHLPKPLAEQAVADGNGRREGDLIRLAKSKSTRQQASAQDSLRASQQTATMIKQADTNFARAARLHSMAIRASTAVKVPEIVPYHVLAEPQHGEESPYLLHEQLRPKAILLHSAASRHERKR